MAGELQYPFELIDNDGGVQRVADGIYWVRTPLPFALNHINLWLLEDGDGFTVVDTGLGSSRVQALWRGVLDKHLRGRPIRRVIVTHFHPDHLGNAGWFVEHFGSELWMTQDEWLMGRLLALDNSDATIDNTAEFFRRCDVEAENIDELKHRGAEYRKIVTVIPRSFHRMYEGDRIEINGDGWEVIVGLGHAPEHACLYCEERRLLLAGDQILPRITPVVGVYPMEPDSNPLDDFLRSLRKFERIDPETLVLPAHERPFVGVQDRLAAMHEHHDERLDRLLEASARPLTARAGVDVLFHRKLDSMNLRLATAETVSHLNMLIARGAVERRENAAGVWEFQAV